MYSGFTQVEVKVCICLLSLDAMWWDDWRCSRVGLYLSLYFTHLIWCNNRCLVLCLLYSILRSHRDSGWGWRNGRGFSSGIPHERHLDNCLRVGDVLFDGLDDGAHERLKGRTAEVLCNVKRELLRSYELRARSYWDICSLSCLKKIY